MIALNKNIQFSKAGLSWIWLSAAGMSIILLLVVGLLLIMISEGTAHFWPAKLYQIELADETIIGQRIAEKSTSESQRWLIKTANREMGFIEFIWLDSSEIQSIETPEDLIVIERAWDGDFYGRLEHVVLDGIQIKRSQGLDEFRHLAAENGFEAASQSNNYLVVTDSRGNKHQISRSQFINLNYVNSLDIKAKLLYALSKIEQFLFSKPYDGNSAGGIYPAIIGTVLMIFGMTIVVAPLGVIAAIYLHEYSKEGAIKRLVNLAVVNLAGVPSIIYGVFGLGFFVYGLGGSIDELFYADALPSPTFGTPGLLWCSLTLALLTLPIVILTTEQGMQRIPTQLRMGSMALGASRIETIRRLVLPVAYPAMLSGLILAMSRAAGEVAALMLVGVVKNTQALPISDHSPYVHMDQKIMHIGYFIYDAGMQSPHIENARSLMFAAALVLALVTLSLNITATTLRGRLQEKYRLFIS